MDELQRVALERNARNFAKERIKNFKANPWHGPVTDAIEMAAGLHNKSCKTSDGQMRIYISYAPHGPELLLSTAVQYPATRRSKIRPRGGDRRHGARAYQIAGACHGALAPW
ncbi:hypothetical protein, partial [Paracoccus pantotrophus]